MNPSASKSNFRKIGLKKDLEGSQRIKKTYTEGKKIRIRANFSSEINQT